MVLNILTIVVMIVLVALTGVILAYLGMLPGKIAKGRNHPQAEAINVASWLGIITLGVLWPFALIWAYYTRPAGASTDTPEEIAGLTARIEALEDQVRGPDQA